MDKSTIISIAMRYSTFGTFEQMFNSPMLFDKYDLAARYFLPAFQVKYRIETHLTMIIQTVE